MNETPQRRIPVIPPAVPAPIPFSDRRIRARRDGDIAAGMEIAFLAGAMDVLAGVGSAEERLASLLQLIAEAAGAQRAAVLADGDERRVTTSVQPNDDVGAADALAAWLDARAPRSRAERAASGPALISLATAAGPGVAASPATDGVPGDVARTDSPELDVAAPDVSASRHSEPGANPAGRYACVRIPSSATVVLGFDFGDGAAADGWEQRFPAAFARHAGAAIALISDEFTTERELALLRAQDIQRTRFVSTVAHELRTPLTGLGGYLDLILTGNVDDAGVAREFLERSHDIVISMDVLVADLLELSRLESGNLQLELEAFSVAEIAQRVIDHLAPLALQGSVQLRANLPPRLRAARGDRRRVEQILRNLLGNAMKFTPRGGTVELAGWFEGPVAVLAVRDDGLGIADEDRVRIFERFYRMASHERVNGTGLGLPIARELARAMGGDLDVASVSRAGSSFVLVLPARRSVDHATITAILDRTLDAEHARLQEAGMLRRLQLLGREAAALRSAPHAEPVLQANTALHDPSVGRGAVRHGRSAAEQSVPLRVLEPRPPIT